MHIKKKFNLGESKMIYICKNRKEDGKSTFATHVVLVYSANSWPERNATQRNARESAALSLSLSLSLSAASRSGRQSHRAEPFRPPTRRTHGGGGRRRRRREGVLQDHPHLRPQAPLQSVSKTASPSLRSDPPPPSIVTPPLLLCWRS
jgi:hypothetical protein